MCINCIDVDTNEDVFDEEQRATGGPRSRSNRRLDVQSLLDVLDDIDVPGALCLDVLYPNPDGRGPLQGSGYLLNDEFEGQLKAPGKAKIEEKEAT